MMGLEDKFKICKGLGFSQQARREAILRKGYPFPMLAKELLLLFSATKHCRDGKPT